MIEQPEHDGHKGVGRTTVWLVAGSEGGVAEAFWERAHAVAFAGDMDVANPGTPVSVREVVVQGERRRCRLCGEAIALDDPEDPESWRHADDANDPGDHTADP